MNLGRKMFLFMLLLGSVIAVVTIGSMLRFQSARMDSQIEIAQEVIGQAVARNPQLTAAEIQAFYDRMDRELRAGARANFLVVIFIAGFAVVIFALAASLIMWAYTSRLHAVAAAAKRIEQGEYYGWKSIRSNDEIGALSLAIDTMAESIRTRTDLLTREKNRLQDVMQSVQAGIIIIDKETRTIVDINPAAEKMLRISREAARGKGCAEFFCDDAGCTRTTCPLLDEGKPVESAERILRNSAGEQLTVLKTVVEIELDGRRCLLENMVDLSEIKREQEKNIRLQCQLVQSQKMEAIGMLAGGIAHDFNNILAPIIGYTSMARQQAGTNQKLLEILEQVNSAAVRAKDLVGQILTFSRKSANRKIPVELSSLVREALQLISSTVPPSVEIRQDIETNARVCADANQIHQVIMNLCTNAFQAMERSGGTLTVSLKEADVSDEQAAAMGCATGRHVMLEVSDTGAGMSGETMERIFDPYFTTKEPGKGTGLGLSVVDGIVKDHGGRIFVSSTPGAGASFRVFLPEMTTLCETAAAPEIDEASGKHERIMYVDDEEAIRAIARDYLREFGYRVDVFAHGTDALAAFERTPAAWDLVITDLVMPGMDGRELARRVRALRHDIPVLLCSGFGASISGAEIAASGISGCLQKPLAMPDLLGSVRQALHRAQDPSPQGGVPG